MSEVPIPTGIGLDEHFCRRWLSTEVILNLIHEPQRQRMIGAQRASFFSSQKQFLMFSIARPLILHPQTISSVTIGFRMSRETKKGIAFWDDPAIPVQQLGETCERCPLTPAECQVRAADGVFYQQMTKRKQLQHALNAFLKKHDEPTTLPHLP
jgi:hypothetical protein